MLLQILSTTNGTVLVKIPGVKDPVEVKVTVNVTNKPFINDGSAKNTPENPNKTTITGNATPGATITVQDDSGNTLKDDKGNDITTKVDDNGNFTVDIPEQTPGTALKLVPSKDSKEGEATTVTVIAKPKAPTITVPSENKDGKTGGGNVTVTPTSGDSAKVVTIVITAKPNPLNGPEKPVRTIVVKKGDDNKWKIDGDYPDGVTVDKTTGKVTIPAKDLEDGSTITAVAKDKDDNPSDKAEKTTGFKTPQISEQTLKDNPDDSTKQIITGKTLPGATVTVTDKDGKQIGTGVADKNGNFTIAINKQTPGAIVNLTPTNGTGDFAKTGNTVEVTVGGDIAVPRIDTPADGSHDNNGNNANSANNANKNGNKNDASGHNGSNNHGNQSHNSGSNSGSRRDKGALGNTGVGVALSALASAMLAGMGAAGRAVSRRKKRN